MGTVIESAGLSTDCTNTVDESLWRVSGTSSGYLMASITAGMNGRISRFCSTQSRARFQSDPQDLQPSRSGHPTSKPPHQPKCTCPLARTYARTQPRTKHPRTQTTHLAGVERLERGIRGAFLYLVARVPHCSRYHRHNLTVSSRSAGYHGSRVKVEGVKN